MRTAMRAHRSVSPHRYPFLGLCLLLALIVSFSAPSVSDAQKGKPVAPPQGVPNIAMPMPMGAQRGTTMELVLTGANLGEPVGLQTSIPGLKATFREDNDNGK